MSNFVEFTFDFEPISVNKLYVNLRGQARRFLSSEGKLFKAKVNQYVIDQLKSNNANKTISGFVKKPLTVSATIGLSSWVLKDKTSVRKKDLDNILKALSDSIFEALRDNVNEDIDDSYVWQITIAKKVTTEPEVTFKISEYEHPL